MISAVSVLITYHIQNIFTGYNDIVVMISLIVLFWSVIIVTIKLSNGFIGFYTPMDVIDQHEISLIKKIIRDRYDIDLIE